MCIRDRRFFDSAQICLATEAAGEGINLQFCHLMINYDIPWNPNRLEQRMGRIHRIGQKKDVYIRNFVADNTVEGMILTRLFTKLEEIRNELGDRVFDVVGQLLMLNEIRLEDMLREVAVNKNRVESIAQTPGNTIQEVKQQEAAYAELRARFAQKYQDVMDLGVALFYNVDIDYPLWGTYAEYAVKSPEEQQATYGAQQHARNRLN